MPIASNEYKSVVGLRDLYYALVTQDDTNAYTAGTPALLAPAMTASLAPAVNSATQYADDGPYDVMTAEGETKISLEVTNLPEITLAAITGAVYDATNHRVFDNGGTPPFVALGFRAKKSSGGYKYYWFLKGRFTKPAEETASDSDTPDPKPLKLEFTAIKTTYQYVMGATTDGVKVVRGDTDETGFSATGWFSAVQVATYGAVSAITCTPSPADGATGVATNVTPTLTFNNQITTGTAGIVLTKNDGVVVACTITINAALKVVTITPGGALTGSAKYLITVSGVKDIHGQSFANTVYDFTCV
jgi:phi13 family phage major tail protein